MYCGGQVFAHLGVMSGRYEIDLQGLGKGRAWLKADQMLTRPGKKAGEGSGHGGAWRARRRVGTWWPCSPMGVDAGPSEGSPESEFGSSHRDCPPFRKGRFVASSDGPFYRCGSAGPGGPQEEALLAGTPRELALSLRPCGTHCRAGGPHPALRWVLGKLSCQPSCPEVSMLQSAREQGPESCPTLRLSSSAMGFRPSFAHRQLNHSSSYPGPAQRLCVLGTLCVRSTCAVPGPLPGR